MSRRFVFSVLPAMNHRFVGYAIVSDDGMLADARGAIPPALVVAEDQAFFMRGLDAAAAIVHGRNSAEQPTAPARRRLIATRRGIVTAPGPWPNSLLWNPEKVSVDEALDRLAIDDGDIAVIGGTDLFGLFLPRYDIFHLTRARGVALPGGRPLFPGIPELAPETLLSRAGLVPGAERVLATGRGVSVVSWMRRSAAPSSVER